MEIDLYPGMQTLFLSTCVGVGSDGSFSMAGCGSPVQRLPGFSLETTDEALFLKFELADCSQIE